VKAAAALDRALGVIEDRLGEGPWLLGERFSAADVMLGSAVRWISFARVGQIPPATWGWIGRLSARPAFQRAYSD